MEQMKIRANNILLKAMHSKLDGKHCHKKAQLICIIRALLRSHKKGENVKMSLKRYIKDLEKIL